MGESSIYGGTVYDELVSQNYSRGIKPAITIHDKLLCDPTLQERFIHSITIFDWAVYFLLYSPIYYIHHL